MQLKNSGKNTQNKKIKKLRKGNNNQANYSIVYQLINK